ncbi:hypothetical protein GA0115254_110717 [Streptomyces sp. Ncost-T10-10d]|nr:hypothetical protein GA0115254_110717 [Streptomyces sp. Ncost-T10-10d]
MVAYLRKVHGQIIRIDREALRCLLARRGTAFQRTKAWEESPDPEREAKLDRIEHVLDRFPDRVFAFDEFGPLGIRPTAGAGWAEQRRPDRLPARWRRQPPPRRAGPDLARTDGVHGAGEPGRAMAVSEAAWRSAPSTSMSPAL